MAIAQTAFRTRPALNRHSMTTARRMQRAEMPLFQAFLRPSSVKVTDGLCIKDSTTIDPAAGSGNFLTESYLSIRRLENAVIKELTGGQMMIDEAVKLIKCSIQQFYGIEINDFAVTVAKTALWIAESQMMKETEDIVNQHLEFLPLKTNAYITEGNALRMDWEQVVPKDRLDYIMGNPPFVGYSVQSKAQKDDIRSVAPEMGANVDYVAMWYVKASQLIVGSTIKVAFVSTNSITQGEQVAIIWKPLFEKYGIQIDFAYRTFRWDSEASLKAQVHCVIVGFSVLGTTAKRIYQNNISSPADNINPYLLDAPTVFIDRRAKPLCDVPPIIRGSSPVDDGNLILLEDEKVELTKKEPLAEKYIRPYMMGKDFVNRTYRYCLWLKDADPADLKKCPSILERVQRVRNFRLASKKAATRRDAEIPTLFSEIRVCHTDYIAIPKVTTQNRRYIPMELLTADVVAGDKLFMMPNATLYHFGVLTSNVHMAWMRAVTGRMKSDYSYSNTVVYNNFPWAAPDEEQKAAIANTAKVILDVRGRYPISSLADLYDELTMPPELRKAHQENDRAVMKAYGFSIKDTTEASCVAALMKMYQEKVAAAVRK